MTQRTGTVLAALVTGLLTLALVGGPAQAETKYWHKSTPGYDSSGRTTLDYCLAVKSRTRGRLVAAAGIAGDRGRLPFRKWPRAGAGYPGLTYKWGPGFSFQDYWVIKFRRDGRVRMSYESGAVLKRVDRGEFRRHCW